MFASIDATSVKCRQTRYATSGAAAPKASHLHHQLCLGLDPELAHRGVEEERDALPADAEAVGDELAALAEGRVGDHLVLTLGEAARIAEARRVREHDDEAPAVAVEPIDEGPAAADETFPYLEGSIRVGFAALGSRLVYALGRGAQSLGRVVVLGRAFCVRD